MPAAAIDAAIGVLKEAGFSFKEVSLPHTSAAIPAYYIIAGAEASTNLSRYDGVRFGHRCENPESLDDLYERSRSEGFGAEVKRRILTGTYALSSGYYDQYYGQAQRARTLIQKDFTEAFANVDVIASPTVPIVAPPLADADDPSLPPRIVANTRLGNVVGLPALTLPAPTDGLPVGLQLMGRTNSEVLGCGEWVERALHG